MKLQKDLKGKFCLVSNSVFLKKKKTKHFSLLLRVVYCDEPQFISNCQAFLSASLNLIRLHLHE